MIEKVGLATLHSLWQGALIALAVILITRRTDNAILRYRIAATGLSLVLLMFVVTTFTPTQTANYQNDVVTPIVQRALFAFPSLMQWIGGAWLAGVLFMAARFAGGWFLAQRQYIAQSREDEQWAHRVGQVARYRRLKTPSVLISDVVDSPAVFGLKSPVLVLPAAGLHDLDAAQVDAIIAHELMHIERRDGVANALQCGVDALFFFNPFVRTLSTFIRTEREHICDTQAVAICSPRSYVTALLSLEETRSRQFVLSANGSALVERVRHLLRPRRSTKPSRIAVALASTLIVIALTGTLIVPPRLHAITQQIAGIMHYTVKASDPGGSFTLQIDRGRAVHATVDGAAVAPGRIQQRSDSIFIYNPRGKRELALRVDPRGGISWYPRSQ